MNNIRGEGGASPPVKLPHALLRGNESAYMYSCVSSNATKVKTPETLFRNLVPRAFSGTREKALGTRLSVPMALETVVETPEFSEKEQINAAITKKYQPAFSYSHNKSLVPAPWLTGARVRRSSPSRPYTFFSEIEEAFKVFDKNGDGEISVSELGEAMKSMGQETSEEDLQAMIVVVDLNGRPLDFCLAWPTN